MSMTLSIIGAAGRMGLRLVALAKAGGMLEITSALERPGHPALGRDVGELAGIGLLNLSVQERWDAPPRVAIDFSSPLGTRNALDLCVKNRVPLVIGTTGLRDEDHRLIDQAAGKIAVLQAPNMSLGVNLLFKIAAQVAATLGEDYDIEIVEAHHRFKKDAPSGTAMGLADAILSATGRGREALVYDRHGEDCPRQPGQIGMHALRLGDEVGRHTAYFATLGERLELTHAATNRDTLVRGALKAAVWLSDKPAGRYGMSDVLGWS